MSKNRSPPAADPLAGIAPKPPPGRSGDLPLFSRTVVTTTIIITTIMIDHSTRSYTQETPGWLWSAFTNGPADEHDRIKDRIVCLQAVDVLENCPEQLTEAERQRAERLAAEVGFYDGV